MYTELKSIPCWYFETPNSQTKAGITNGMVFTTIIEDRAIGNIFSTKFRWYFPKPPGKTLKLSLTKLRWNHFRILPVNVIAVAYSISLSAMLTGKIKWKYNNEVYFYDAAVHVRTSFRHFWNEIILENIKRSWNYTFFIIFQFCYRFNFFFNQNAICVE